MRGTFWFHTVFLLYFVSVSNAAVVSTEVPYYGEQFYQDLKNNASSDTIVYDIKKALRSFHARQDNDKDLLVTSCDSYKACYSQVVLGYDRARVFLMGVFYLVNEGANKYGVRDVYCQKEYRWEDFPSSRKPGPNLIPSDGVINTEHTWPQSRFTNKFAKEMQKSDLHHLFPTDSDMNSVRGSNEFGEVVKDTKNLKCPGARSGVSAQGRPIFEPPDVHKGHVARALFYFALRYDMFIKPEEEATLRKWNKQYPVDDEEALRNETIYKYQGNRNPFIDHPELADLISDF